ncbi:MAG: MBL fold metallo-hydrolase, partial [Flavitalea sp.]
YAGELIYLAEGVPIPWDDEECSVLFTPGHSPGSLSFYFPHSGFVVSGDVLFRSGIGRTDLPGGDYQTLIDSIRRELFTLPESVVVYSGHGPQTTIGYEKKNNPYLNQAAR